MIRYTIKKFLDYFIRKIDKKLEQEILNVLNTEERKIYFNMDYYDRYHGISVYNKLVNTDIPKIYLKLGVLHDCGKENAKFYLRVLHKIGFKTILREHSKMGYNKLKDINYELAKLVLVHHNKTNDKYMKIFQDADDRS